MCLIIYIYVFGIGFDQIFLKIQNETLINYNLNTFAYCD